MEYESLLAGTKELDVASATATMGITKIQGATVPDRTRVIRKVNSGFEILRPGSLVIKRDGETISEVEPEAPTKQPRGKLRKKEKFLRRSNRGSAFFEAV